MPDRRRSDRADHPADTTLATRLAELVSELTGTPTDSALVAVRSEAHDHGRDALEVVAAAMVHLDEAPDVDDLGEDDGSAGST